MPPLLQNVWIDILCLMHNCAGGQLSERFGAKYFFGLGVGGTALLTVLTPVATRGLGLTGLLACRALEGLLEVRLPISRGFPSTCMISTRGSPRPRVLDTSPLHSIQTLISGFELDSSSNDKGSDDAARTL